MDSSKLTKVSAKHAIEERARSNPSFSTLAACYVGWYYENFHDPSTPRTFGGFPSTPDAEGCITWKSPLWGSLERIPWIGMVDDWSDIVAWSIFSIFKNGAKNRSKGFTDIASFAEMADAFQEGIACKP